MVYSFSFKKESCARLHAFTVIIKFSSTKRNKHELDSNNFLSLLRRMMHFLNEPIQQP